MKNSTFWLSFITNRGGKTHSIAVNEPYMDIDEARKQLEKIREDDDVLAAWVDEFNSDNKKVGTPIMECYINCFGTREMWRFKEGA